MRDVKEVTLVDGVAPRAMRSSPPKAHSLPARKKMGAARRCFAWRAERRHPPLQPPSRRVLLLAYLSATLLLALTAAGRADDGAKLRDLEAVVKKDPADFAAWNTIADAELSLLGETADLAHLTRAAAAVEQSLKSASPESNRGGLAMRARVALASHHFADAKRDAEQLRALMPDSGYPLQLLGDALFNLGAYDDAARVWAQMLARDGSTPATEPRLAQLDLIHGRTERAKERLTAALKLARQLAPPAPGTVAWCQVQLGELAFRSGDWETAETQYAAALFTQPDDSAAQEHLAELRGAQGRFDEAIALYTREIARTPRPELMQALGDLCISAQRTADAKIWRDRALAAYLASTERGEILYRHHLSSFYADSLNDPAHALDCAQREFNDNPSLHATDALAWALRKAGKTDEAAALAARALATGTRDAHILYHAGMIRMGAGDITGGGTLLQQALAANPRYNSFHVHR